MRTLVIDTATRACSVALFDDLQPLDARHDIIGRGHAEVLLPMIASLPERGKADRIAVNVGPGSFTGIRVGVAAARALALAWNAEIGGYSCLSLIAAMTDSDSAVDVVMTGGHGEYFFQSFDAEGSAKSGIQSLTPDAAARLSTAPIVAGDMAETLVNLRGSGIALSLLPDARQWQRIAGLAPLPPSPVYGRAPDAKLPRGLLP